MAGILNKKEKFIDLVVTQEGKRQMADGDFRPTFASFTDKHTFYDKTDTNAKGSHAEDRLMLQAQESSNIDKIILEVDDGGVLTYTDLSDKFSIVGDQVFHITSSADGLNLKSLIQTGSQFASTAGEIKASTIENFKKNKILKTLSGFERDGKEFKLSHDKYTFVISNSVPFPLGPTTEHSDIDSAEPFMFDKKLAHYKNFMYLPPVNVNHTDELPSYYGSYSDLRSTSRETWDDIKNNLRIEKIDFDRFAQVNTVLNYSGDFPVLNRAPTIDPHTTKIAKELTSVYFSETSNNNNVFLQVYELDNNQAQMIKLDIVDAGEFIDSNDIERPVKHVFYVGKVLYDNNNFPTFVNIFTLVWD